MKGSIMATDDVTKGAAELKAGLDAIDALAEWTFGQTTAAIAGALALLPENSFQSAALTDMGGDSKEAKARAELARAIVNVRLLLEGVKAQCFDSRNTLDCEIEELRIIFSIQTDEQLQTLVGVAALSTIH
jgi:hypothetical protein